MRQEVELFLGGKSVEFAEPPEILFSYIRTDYTDPTVLRNSYSKTLNIEGTPNNNALFNGIYHLDKISDYGTFNPAKRMEFQLFSNGDILEQGYAKLDKINKEGKNISYDITLYGGLGEFLYNLSYDQTAEGSDTSRGGGEDRRLSSLIYYDDNNPNTEFDFNITRDTVAEAWEALEKGTGATMWQYINFAPAYNGFPENFDADKVLINTQNSSCPVIYNNNGETGTSTGFPTSIKQGDSTYRAYNNYAIGELPKEMTEFEMRDLRSYLQRPVLSMKGFINAISNPANNGGYNVVLDSSFFNDNNPYYSKAWFTLPLLHKDETVTGQAAKTEVANDVLSISSSMGESYDTRYYLQGLQPGAVYQGIELNFQFNVDVSGMPNQIMTTAFDYKAGGLFARDAGYYSSIFVQMIGEDENGNAIAGSPIYNFTSPYGEEEGLKIIIGNQWEGPQDLYCDRKFFDSAYTPVLETSDVNVLGRFVKTSGNHYVWKNINGDVVTLTAKLDDRFEYHRIYFRVTKVMRWRDYKRNGNPDFNRFEDRIFSGLTGNGVRENILMGWVDNQAWLGGDWGLSAKTATTQVSVVGSQAKYTVASDVVRSGDHISKGDLLNFDGTPCDYLLSYCKLFNLFLSKDTYEKKIYIRTRDSFYNGGTIDLDKFIDRSKDIKVSPLAMDSRWYDFAYPEEEKCSAAEDYDFNYGVEYGKNKVQTTYEFDSAARDLFEDNIFQNGVQVQESSKYFTLRTINNGRGKKTVPTFLYNAIEYKLFNSPNDAISSCVILPPSGFTQDGYTSADGKEDWMPKLQLNNDNKSIDGQNVLCFYGGFKSSPYIGGQQVIYYLTDDLAEMYVLNGETPCWLWTKTEKNGEQTIAKGMTKLPIFSRMLYTTENTTGVTDTKISYTWDFGRVRNTYVPIKSYVDKATIYERWWANYIADLYDYNTRVVEAYVKMEGKVVGDWLRAFYWWDNCYWVLTEINDYNITSYDTTKCKFVKVNDISNYTSGSTPPQPSMPIATLVPSKYMIAASGETITAVVKTSDGGAWHLEYPSYVHPSQVAGTGDTSITLRFDANPNSDGRDFNVSAFRTVGTPTHFWQEGTDTTDKELTLNGFEGNGGLIFDYSSQTFNTLTITYRNRGSNTVTISGAPAWLTPTLSQWNGETAVLTLSLASNSGTTVRSATITVSAPGASSKTIKIDQLPEQVEISNNGGSQSITLLNTAYTVSALNAYWATIKTSGETITFSADANTAQTARYELVGVSVDEGIITSASTQLIQAGGGGNLTVVPSAITAEWNGGDKMIVVQCMSNWIVSDAPDWVTLSSESGTSGQSVVIVTLPEYDGNTDRTGDIIFTDGTRTASTRITQQQKSGESLNVTPPSLYFDYTGQTLFLIVSCTSPFWRITSKPDWVVISQDSGRSGTSMIAVTAPLNTGVTRSGDIMVTDLRTVISCQMIQPSSSSTPSITLSPTTIVAENSGGTYQITVNYGNRNGDDVAFTCSESWVSVGPVSWTGDTGRATVTVANYGTNMPREATITATGILAGVTATATVHQKELPFINLNPVSVLFEQSGGTASVTLQSNTDWIIEITDTN